MIRALLILLLLFAAVSLQAAPADASVPVFGPAAGKGLTLSTPMQIVILLTLLTLLPAAIMSVSPFLRIAIVLHFLRQALGTQAAPSNQVLVGLALFLAFLVMQPVVYDVYHQGWEPVESGQLTWQEGFEKGAQPLKAFLLKFSREKDIKTCLEIAKSPAPRIETARPLARLPSRFSWFHSTRRISRVPSGDLAAGPPIVSRSGLSTLRCTSKKPFISNSSPSQRLNELGGGP